MVNFYKSILGLVTHSERKTFIELLIKHIKTIYMIDPVPARGLEKVQGIILLAVLLYQILVYYNCKVIKNNNLRRDISM